MISLEIREKHPLTKENIYESKTIKFDNDEFKYFLRKYSDEKRIKKDISLPKKLKELCEENDFNFKKEIESKYKFGVDKANITFKEYCHIFMEKHKMNTKASTWSRDADVLPFLIDKLGNYKLSSLDKHIIQDFVDEVDKKQKEIVVITPKDEFADELKKNGYDYASIRKKLRNNDEEISANKINHYSLGEALKGKNVSEKFAKNLCKITNIKFERLFEKKVYKEQIAFNTKKKYINLLSKILSQASKDDYIIKNYCNKNDITMFKNQKNNEKKCMDHNELKIFKSNFEKLNYNRPAQIALMILIETGIRKEELIGLKWNSIDFNNNQITIRNTVTYNKHTGINVLEKSTKTKKSYRRLMVSEVLMDKLKKYKEYQLDRIKSEPNNTIDVSEDNYWLFMQTKSNNFGKVLFPSTVNEWLKKYLEICNIKHYTVHEIRHTFITNLIENNNPINLVSLYAGHCNISTTLNTYTHAMNVSNFNELSQKDSSIEERIKKLNVIRDIIGEEAYKKRLEEILKEI